MKHYLVMYFCLHCLTGKETSVLSLVKKYADISISEPFKVWFPTKEVTEKKNGEARKRDLPLFPGYVFLWWDGEEETQFPFRDIAGLTDVIRFLKYGNGKHSLTGQDLKYASWIHDNDGFISQSKVIFKEGQHIHIVDGPLVGFDGNVVKVDKHHKRITVRFKIGDTVSDVSFSVEFLQHNAAKKSTEV